MYCYVQYSQNSCYTDIPSGINVLVFVPVGRNVVYFEIRYESDSVDDFTYVSVPIHILYSFVGRGVNGEAHLSRNGTICPWLWVFIATNDYHKSMEINLAKTNLVEMYTYKYFQIICPKNHWRHAMIESRLKDMLACMSSRQIWLVLFFKNRIKIFFRNHSIIFY